VPLYIEEIKISLCAKESLYVRELGLFPNPNEPLFTEKVGIFSSFLVLVLAVSADSLQDRGLPIKLKVSIQCFMVIH